MAELIPIPKPPIPPQSQQRPGKLNMTELVDFPVELLCQIFQWIPRKQSFVLRSVCKTFEAAANRSVFSEVSLSTSHADNYLKSALY